MAYIGKEPQFTQYPSKFFNGDGTAMTISLDYVPPNDAAILVFIDGVRQDTSAYSCSGSSLTFTGNVPSGSNNVQVVHLGLSVDVGTVGDGTITSAKIVDGAIVNADINASASIAMSKLATDPTNASNLASGTVPTARLGSGTASSSVFLRGDQSWASAGSSAIVVVHMSTSQIFSKDVWEKIDFDTEVFDTNGEYDTTNKRFTPTTAGYYQFSMSLVKDDGETQTNNMYMGVYKNGSLYKSTKRYLGATDFYQIEATFPFFQTVVYCNGSSDYLEPWFAWGANGQLELDVYPDSLTTGKGELTIIKVD